ncbi:hypothetical protein MRX96_010399 [Rhipicephalus microplus]
MGNLKEANKQLLGPSLTKIATLSAFCQYSNNRDCHRLGSHASLIHHDNSWWRSHNTYQQASAASIQPVVTTRGGRTVKAPSRLDL